MKLNQILIGVALLFVIARISSLAAADGALPEEPREAYGGAGDTSAVEQLRVGVEQLAVADRRSTTPSAQDAAKVVAVVIMNRRLSAREPKNSCGCCAIDLSAVFERCPACQKSSEFPASDVVESSKEVNELFLEPTPEAMYKAILNGQQAEMVALLDHPSAPENFVNQCLPGGRTPLTLGISLQNEEMVKFLLDGGADVTRVDQYEPDEFPLEAAIWSGNEKIVAILLNHARTPNDFVNQPFPEGSASCVAVGMTPLTYAILCRSVGVVRCLLEHGAAVDLVDRHNRSPLGHAICNTKECVAALLDHPDTPKDLVNKPLPEGCMPLAYARECRNLEVTHYLLSRDDVNKSIFPASVLAGYRLDAAISRGDKEAVAAALSLADTADERLKLINERLPGPDRGSSLNEAVRLGHIPIMCFLLDSGADITGKNTSFFQMCRERSPLGDAIGSNIPAVVKALLDHPSAPKDLVNQRSANGCLPLTLACRCSCTEIVSLLLSRGAGILTPAGKLDLFLFVAAIISGMQMVVELFLEHSKAPKTLIHEPLDNEMNMEYTPLGWALFGGHSAMIKFLRSRGASIATPDGELDHALFTLAIERNNQELVQEFLNHPCAASTDFVYRQLKGRYKGYLKYKPLEYARYLQEANPERGEGIVKMLECYEKK